MKDRRNGPYLPVKADLVWGLGWAYLAPVGNIPAIYRKPAAARQGLITYMRDDTGRKISVAACGGLMTHRKDGR